jgi:hypothetical protein
LGPEKPPVSFLSLSLFSVIKNLSHSYHVIALRVHSLFYFTRQCVRSSLFSHFSSISLFSRFSPGSAGGDRALGWRRSGSMRPSRQSTAVTSSSPPHRRVDLHLDHRVGLHLPTVGSAYHQQSKDRDGR